jgi:hypothetical protein
MPPGRELSHRIAVTDQAPGLARQTLWAERVRELRRRLRLEGRDGLGMVRASQDYSDAVDVIEAEKRKKRPRRRLGAERPYGDFKHVRLKLLSLGVGKEIPSFAPR